MEARQLHLLRFISGEDKRLIIPVFQRNYDWKKNNCEKLFDDILTMAYDKSKKSHFIGSIVYVSNSDVDMVDLREYVIIDGQQRITTIILLLKAICDYIDNNNLIDKENKSLRNKIYDYYLINKYQNEQNKLRLKPMKEDDVVYKQIMTGSYNDIQSSSNIIISYNYLYNKISSCKVKPKDIFEAAHKLMIVYISLKRGEDDPQLIFESINSTGVTLTQADLIRNFVLMDKEPEEQEQLYERYWFIIEKNLTNEKISDFVRDFLIMKNRKIPKKSEVYTEFKSFIKNSNESINDMLEMLKYYSKLYSKIAFSNTGLTEIDNLLIKLNKLKITVSYPYLLKVYFYYDKGKIQLEDFKDVLNTIISYTFRRLICELPSNALSKIFSNLDDEVNKYSNFEKYIEKLQAILTQKKSSSAFPTDTEFRNSLIQRNIYSFKHRNYLLEELENFDNKEKVNINELTIEHIMPQNLTSQWKATLGKNYRDIHDINLHRLGNLTLTAYNGNLSNKPFQEKKLIYRNSRLRLNCKFDNIDNWNEHSISSRAVYLSEIALQIWDYPKVDTTDLGIYIENKDNLSLDDDIDVTGLQPSYFEILGEKISIKSWREFFTKTVETLLSLDKKRLIALVEDPNFKGSVSNIVSNEASKCRKPYEILPNELYLETNLSANSLLNYTKLICEKMGLEHSDFQYGVR